VKLSRRIQRWWYQSAPPQRLGVLRAASGAYALWYVLTRRNLILELSTGGEVLYEPVGVLRLLGAAPPDFVVQAVVYATIATGVLFVLGAGHRVVGPVFSLLLLGVMCYRNSWSMIYHMDNALVVHALILGFAKSADGFSLDAALRARRTSTPVPPADRYGWPIRLICAVTAMSYFVSGFAKVCGPEGFAWALGGSLRDQVAVDALRKEVLELQSPALAWMLYEQVWLFTLIGVGTLVIELGAPLFLLERRLSRLWAVSAWLMHWGIFFIMGILFRYQLSFLIFLSFFNVEVVALTANRALRFVRRAPTRTRASPASATG
jgi:hypothetical protein